MRNRSVQDVRARKRLNRSRKMHAAGCSALAVIALMLGSQGLETAVANGDTRTISLHHIHTNEDITITFKRDGRYDDDALKKLNWFVRDWRKEEQIDMDPHLFDLVWEASREVGGSKVIHVVCGYRSPETNAMLHARSNGVAKFSQHMLGKAMDFYVPGTSLEELRNAGLRLERGGVGYYPTSGSPFVHMDVGNVRHWGPPIGDTEMAKIMSEHPVHVAALAANDKRSASQATPIAPHKKPPVVSPEGDEDEAVAAKPVPARAAAARTNTYTVASLDSRPAELGRPVTVAAATAVPLPHARPAKAAAMASENGAPAATDRTKLAHVVPAKTNEPETIGGVIWPVRVADNDRVPLDMALAYAPPQSLATPTAMRPETTGSGRIHLAAATIHDDATAVAPLDDTTADAPHDNTMAAAPRENTTTVVKKTVVGTPSVEPVVPSAAPVAKAAEPVAKTADRVSAHAAAGGSTTAGGTTVTTKVVNANAGMRYDDPWLRAMIMTPSISDSMTATLYGRPDLTDLRNLMLKPNASLMLSFNEDPNSGPAPDQFRGDAVVFLTNHAFDRHTAWLQ